MLNGVFEWEKPLIELEKKIEELRRFTKEEGIDFSAEIATLESRAENLRHDIYSRLTPWQKVMIARHPRRPTCLDYIELIFGGFSNTMGPDHRDPAMVGHCPPGRAAGDGHRTEGKDTKDNIASAPS